MSLLIDVPLDLIDPHPDQPRRGKLPKIAEIAASIAKDGVLQPPLLKRDGERYIIVDGARRVAGAKKAGLTSTPAIVAETWSEVGMIEAAMATNLQREDMTPVETAMGMQTLIDHGVTRESVIRITGRSAQDLDFALAIAKAPKKIVAKFAGVQASLEEAAALVEFGDDKSVIDTLERYLGTATFAQVASGERHKRKRAAQREAALAKLTKQGVRILTTDPSCYDRSKGIPLGYLQDVTAAAHKKCPGHAALIDYDGKPAFFCTDAAAQHDYKSSCNNGPAKDLVFERRKRASRAGFKAARDVRHDYAKRLIAGADQTFKGWKLESMMFVANYAITHGLPCRGEYGMGERITAFLPKSASPIEALLALAIAQQEKAIDDFIKYSGGVLDPNDRGFDTPEGFQPYYQMLKLAGYALADCETALFAEVAERIAKRAEGMAKAAIIADASLPPDDTLTVDPTATVTGHVEGDTFVVDTIERTPTVEPDAADPTSEETEEVAS